LRFSAAEQADLVRVLRAGMAPGRPLLQYTREDFPFDAPVLATARRA